MAEQGTYTPSGLPSDGETIDASDVRTDLQGLADEFNKQVPLSKISSEQSWTSWTPTLTPDGSMTYTSVTITYAKYQNYGRKVYFALRVSGTIGGTLDNEISISLPVTTAASLTGWTFSAITDQGVNTTALAFWQNTTTIAIRKYDSSNFSAGALNFSITGFYEPAS